ncbi:MAG: hypothetical protein ACFFFO_18115, partial [Candidatus Thorarchaeota archaeon]
MAHATQAENAQEGLNQVVLKMTPKTTPTQQTNSSALIVVAKQPAPGRTKTRLTPPLSPEHAAALYECFLRDTLDLMRHIPDVQPVVAYLPPEARAYFRGVAPDFELLLQEGQSLGARLDNALTC